MTDVLLVTDTDDHPDRILPALSLLHHDIRLRSADSSDLSRLGRAHVVLVDGRHDLPAARARCRLLRTGDLDHVVIAVVTQGGLAGVSDDWLLDDVLVENASPAEVDTRVRLATARLRPTDVAAPVPVIQHGAIRIEPGARNVTVDGERATLTYQEFQLLAHLAEHPGRVFSRDQLLTQVWGRQYDGGSRTVDVHVRRLRVALGRDHAPHIVTVRRVGYKFVPEPWRPGHAAPLAPTDAPPTAALVADAADAPRRRHLPDRTPEQEFDMLEQTG